VLVIKDKDTTEVIERWQFDIHVRDKADSTLYVLFILVTLGVAHKVVNTPLSVQINTTSK
jgi:hypothetical protein